MTDGYDDMIGLPHPTSAKHPRMSAIDRAAQFSPFAALSGHGAAIRETARLTERRIELDEDAKAKLDQKLRFLTEHRADRPEVVITYFRADQKKDGGSYQTVTGTLKKLDDVQRIVVMANGVQIPVNDIYEIESEFLPPLMQM